MAIDHLEFHVEERSMEVALRTLVPRMIGDIPFDVYPYQGKPVLLRELPKRLRSQASWLPATWRMIVIIDADDDDCVQLRAQLDQVARKARLRVRGAKPDWQIVNRIAVEELEAWYFGDWDAVRSAFPRVPAGIVRQASFRHPDEIRGGTCEAFERVLQDAGYFAGGLQKVAAARAVAAHMDAARNRSPSFGKLRDVLAEIAA